MTSLVIFITKSAYLYLKLQCPLFPRLVLGKLFHEIWQPYCKKTAYLNKNMFSNVRWKLILSWFHSIMYFTYGWYIFLSMLCSTPFFFTKLNSGLLLNSGVLLQSVNWNSFRNIFHKKSYTILMKSMWMMEEIFQFWEFCVLILLMLFDQTTYKRIDKKYTSKATVSIYIFT